MEEIGIYPRSQNSLMMFDKKEFSLSKLDHLLILYPWCLLRASYIVDDSEILQDWMHEWVSILKNEQINQHYLHVFIILKGFLFGDMDSHALGNLNPDGENLEQQLIYYTDSVSVTPRSTVKWFQCIIS